MKNKFTVTTFVFLVTSVLASAATNEVAAFVERGLFEEEANHQLEAAISNYKQAIEHFDHERQLAATAIFRLGECYRKEGKTNEANAQYERVAREFPDQTQLAQLSQGYLPVTSGTVPGLAAGSPPLPADEAEFLSKAIKSFQTSPDLINQQLDFAVKNGYGSAAEYLLAHGTDVNMNSPIIAAAEHGNEAMVRLLLRHGAAPNSSDTARDGHTPLSFAVEKGFMAVCLTLLDNGADVNLRSTIVTATTLGNEAMVQLLLSHGAAVDGPDSGGHTALSVAARRGYTTLCHTLVAHGADVNAKSNDGSTPLLVAVEQGNLAVAEFLMTNKAQIDATNNYGQTPLFLAIRRADTNMVKLLLENHAEADKPIERVTPLLWAVWAQSKESPAMIELLADHGANPNPLDPSRGWTALVTAIDRGMVDVVRALATHGADVNILDNNGLPPLGHLRAPLTDASRQMEEILIKAGADANYNRRRAIWMTGAGGTPKMEIFGCPTNSINHYTLLESVAMLYQVTPSQRYALSGGHGPYLPGRYAHDIIPFPDFAHVAIRRLDGIRSNSLAANLAEILQLLDRSKDVALVAGDIVEMSKQEHKVAEQWPGLSDEQIIALNKCLWRMVQVVAKDHTNEIALVPPIADEGTGTRQPDQPPVKVFDLKQQWPNWLTESLKGRKADTVIRSFYLHDVVRDANVLLNTWDLSRVRLVRGGAKHTFDLTGPTVPSVWLEEGDVIEISEIGDAPTADAK